MLLKTTYVQEIWTSHKQASAGTLVQKRGRPLMPKSILLYLGYCNPGDRFICFIAFLYKHKVRPKESSIQKSSASKDHYAHFLPYFLCVL